MNKKRAIEHFYDNENKKLVDNLTKSKRWNKLSISNQERIINFLSYWMKKSINNYKKNQKIF